MKRVLCMMTILMLALSAQARAADAQARAADVITPYVDAQTVLVVRVDVSRLNLATLKTWLLEAVREGQMDRKDVEPMLDEGIRPLGLWMTAFTRCGGRDIYILGDTSFSEPTIVIPLYKDANPVALKGTLQNVLPRGPRHEFQEQEHALVWGSPQRFAQPAQPRPGIVAALDAAGDAPLAVALTPSPDVRKLVAQLAPTLPPELGGGASAPLAESCVYALATLRLEPKLSLQVSMQTPDAPAAGAAAASLARLLQAVARTPELVREAPALAEAVGAIKPTVDGKRVDLPLDAHVQKLTGALVRALGAARENAQVVMAINNARQILVACHMYSDQHKGLFPPSLEDAANAAHLPPAIMTIPNAPGAKWTYLPPTLPLEKMAPVQAHVVLHSPADPWPASGVIVGFADGHVELIKDRASYADLLADTKRANEKK